MNVDLKAVGPGASMLFHILESDSQLLQTVDAAFADSARRSGEHLVCHPGCTQCCHGAFAINPLDAWRLRVSMQSLMATNPYLAATIEQRAVAYLKEYAASYPGNLSTGELSEDDQAAFEDFANDAPCPALDTATGLCDLYDARPITCRVFGPPIRSAVDSHEAFSVCELCFIEATPENVAAAEMQIPYDEETHALEALADAHISPAGETIVAFCLTAFRPENPDFTVS
jgi:Fe-S-cluster containining protein